MPLLFLLFIIDGFLTSHWYLGRTLNILWCETHEALFLLWWWAIKPWKHAHIGCLALIWAVTLCSAQGWPQTGHLQSNGLWLLAMTFESVIGPLITHPWKKSLLVINSYLEHLPLGSITMPHCYITTSKPVARLPGCLSTLRVTVDFIWFHSYFSC